MQQSAASKGSYRQELRMRALHQLLRLEAPHTVAQTLRYDRTVKVDTPFRRIKLWTQQSTASEATYRQELCIHALDQLLWLEVQHTLGYGAGCHTVPPLLHILHCLAVEVIWSRWIFLLHPPAVVVECRVVPTHNAVQRKPGGDLRIAVRSDCHRCCAPAVLPAVLLFWNPSQSRASAEVGHSHATWHAELYTV